MTTNILVQNLSEVVSDFDISNGVAMVSPNNWSSAKHGLRGYSTARQLRNAIKRKMEKQPAPPFRWKLSNGKFVHAECREAYQSNKAKGPSAAPVGKHLDLTALASFSAGSVAQAGKTTRWPLQPVLGNERSRA